MPIFFLLFLFVSPAIDAQVLSQSVGSFPSRVQPQTARVGQGVVVSDSLEASQWGAEILRRGGNAVDAAVATAWMLAVTRPHFASLGGGGFLVYCPHQGECESLDYREVAPRELPEGLKQAEIRVGAKSAGIPGTVAGLTFAQKRWGSKALSARVLDQPIAAARNGVEFTQYMQQSVADRAAKGELSSELIQWVGKARAGQRIRNPKLSRLLALIRSKGSDGFYRGITAGLVVEEIKRRGGFWTLGDLARYAPRVRVPLMTRWNGHTLATMGPPSSGGVVLQEILQILESRKSKDRVGSIAWQQDYVRASAIAFSDRAQFLGDPESNPSLPAVLLKILDPARISERINVFGERTKTTWQVPEPDRALMPSGEGDHTTHLSVIDASGNAVALTTTINDSFGSGVYLPSLGIVLNNEMDDFSAQPGVANDFGLVGSEANRPAPGRRPLSSMTPTIVRTSQGGVITLGAAGGPRIISAVAQTLIWRLRGGMSLADAVSQPRLHHQWKPNELKVEPGALTPDARDALQAWGLQVETSAGPLARVYAAERLANGEAVGVVDPRGEGQAAAIAR